MSHLNKFISMMFFIAAHTILYGHGFGQKTLIQLPNNGLHQTIHAICLESLHNTISIESYDIANSCVKAEYIKIGKKSRSNCYIKLGFGKQFDETNDIICVPTQEFYIPAYRKWLPAYMITEGDGLLTSHLKTQTITIKEFIPKPLTVYMLEIEQTHTFFVSKYCILTHNIFLPMAMSLGVSIPFGSIIAGSIGSFFGTAAITAGFTFGGLVGIAIKTIYDNQIHRYKMLHYDIISLDNYCSLVSNKEYETIQPPGCFEQHTFPAFQHIFPIEYPSVQANPGCIDISGHTLGTTYAYDTTEQEKVIDKGCFQPNKYTNKPSSSIQKSPIQDKPHTGGKSPLVPGVNLKRIVQWANNMVKNLFIPVNKILKMDLPYENFSKIYLMLKCLRKVIN